MREAARKYCAKFIFGPAILSLTFPAGSRMMWLASGNSPRGSLKTDRAGKAVDGYPVPLAHSIPTRESDKMAELHKPWILAALAEGLVRFEDAEVTVKNVPNKGDVQKVPFKAATFNIESPADASALYTIAEADRGTIELEDGTKVPGDNPVGTLLAYAYGLNCRAKVRAQFEGRFEDPDKAVKKIADMLVKSGQFKSFDKALSAAKLMREEPDEE